MADDRLAKAGTEKDTKVPWADHVLNLMKAAMASAPFCGGIASLMTDYIPSARWKRLEDFAVDVASDLERLQERVDAEFIRTDEFAFVFEQCFRGAAESYQQEKLTALRGVLVNSSIVKDIPQLEKEYYLNVLGRLTPLHMRILSFLANPTAYLLANGIESSAVHGSLAQVFQTVLPGTGVDVVKCAFQDLYDQGLLNTESSIFSVMTASQGLDLVGNRLTDVGREFVSFSTPE